MAFDDAVDVGIAGDDDALCGGVVLDGLFEELRAVHARHAVVDEDDRDLVLLEQIEADFTAGCGVDPVLLAQHALEQVQVVWLVVDDEDARAVLLGLGCRADVAAHGTSV